VLTGSARLVQEAEDDAAQSLKQQEIERKQVALDRKREAMEAQILLLRAEFEAEKSEALKVISIEKARRDRVAENRTRMAQSRKGDAPLEAR
jgi:circadian clock protein KaiC